MRRRSLLQGLAAAGGLSLVSPGKAWAQKTGRWVRFESPNFICFASGDESKALEEMVQLERFDAFLSKLIPRKERSPLKLQLYVAGNGEDFRRSSPGMGSSVAGFYSSDIEQVRAVTAPDRAYERQRNMKRNIRALDARVVLFHEYAHHFQSASIRRVYPGWYREGFAEAVSTVVFEKDFTQVGMFTSARAAWLASGEWLPIEKFLQGTLRGGDDTSMFYAQAWLAAHYLFMNRERAQGFDRYCLALERGEDSLQAFEPAFGITYKTFDTELRDYKRSPLKILGMSADTTDYKAAITSRRFSPAADSIMMPYSFLRAVPIRENAKESVEIVSREAAKHPDDPFAQTALAHVEVWYGDLAKARLQLDALLKSLPDDPEIRHLSGLCDLRSAYASNDLALFKRARGAFAAAHRLDASRAVSLYRYFECVLNIEGELTDHGVEVLVEANFIAPQIHALALVTAQALMHKEKWSAAEAILRPLASSVHRSDDSRANELYEAAKARQKVELTLYASAAALSDEYEMINPRSPQRCRG